MPDIKIEGYRGVARTEGTTMLPGATPVVGQLTFWMATLNLLSHYFGGELATPWGVSS